MPSTACHSCGARSSTDGRCDYCGNETSVVFWKERTKFTPNEIHKMSVEEYLINRKNIAKWYNTYEGGRHA